MCYNTITYKSPAFEGVGVMRFARTWVVLATLRIPIAVRLLFRHTPTSLLSNLTSTMKDSIIITCCQYYTNKFFHIYVSNTNSIAKDGVKYAYLS